MKPLAFSSNIKASLLYLKPDPELWPVKQSKKHSRSWDSVGLEFALAVLDPLTDVPCSFHSVLLAVSIIFMIGILYLWRQSRNRKRANRNTQTDLLASPFSTETLKSRPSQRQKSKGEEAKRRQNLAWGVVDEESGEKDADDIGGIGSLSTDAIRRMGIARTDSGLIGTAVLSKSRSPQSPYASPLAGVGSGIGPRSPPKALDMPDSHRKLSNNPFSNQHASNDQHVSPGSSQTSPVKPSPLKSSTSPVSPPRPPRPSEAGTPTRPYQQRQQHQQQRQGGPARGEVESKALPRSGIKFPDTAMREAVAAGKSPIKGASLR